MNIRLPVDEWLEYNCPTTGNPCKVSPLPELFDSFLCVSCKKTHVAELGLGNIYRDTNGFTENINWEWFVG